ncbi:response regulator [Halorubrum ezzemoulense]|uniref:PAS domain S-box-containing protein n=1 Tax=Halorubrum ezzemoulense TaxID=337243 RepID=A0A238UVW0_HALEZ|nr:MULTISPECIES: response regulator [Halorubrum]MDB2245646.1 response regulator [Halorubrum ezzemoulense]MDB2271380.1 response regulator [Halorubrum ezzemoulense]MDB2278976.1 response regulator [Halorubrum ezzemoulense]MDB2287602.1 response regulator [Halorubrum ezzemoulense]MDB2291049.1 response regulator [Halorubrum ezzemoulense]
MSMADRPPIRVLCVDDEPGFATLTADILDQQHDDIRAVGVTSAEAALDRLDESTFDCVVSDYDMPDVDGLELLDAVRERYPSKPFILFTGRGSEAIASEAISSGVSDYLQKSGGQEQYELLANRIRTCVTRLRERRDRERVEDWYSQLFEQRLIGAGLSQDRSFELANRRLAEMLGMRRDELVGEPVSSIVAPHDRDRVVRAIRRRESGDDDRVRYTIDLLAADGSTFQATVVGSRVTYRGEPAILGLIQPTGADEAAASQAVRGRIEAASRILSRPPSELDAPLLSTANTHLAEVLGALDTGDSSPTTPDPTRPVQLSDAVGEAVSQAGLSATATVTVDPDGSIDRDRGTVVLAVRNILQAALDEAVDAVAVDARTTADGFRVLVRDPRSESAEECCVAELPFDVGLAGDAMYGIDLFMRRIPGGVRCDAVVAER